MHHSRVHGDIGVNKPALPVVQRKAHTTLYSMYSTVQYLTMMINGSHWLMCLLLIVILECTASTYKKARWYKAYARLYQ